jgi:hypothetical protein
MGVLGVVLVVAGCGVYSTKPGRLREGLETIAVPIFENRTTEPGIEIQLTDTITEALIRDRTLRIVSENEADSLMLATIRRFRIGEAFFGADRTAEEYKVEIAVEVTIVDRAGGDPIVGPRTIRGEGSYYIDEGPEGEAAARDQATDQIVEGILGLVVEEW